MYAPSDCRSRRSVVSTRRRHAPVASIVRPPVRHTRKPVAARRARWPSLAVPASQFQPPLSSRDDFLAFRRSLPRTPRLERQTVRARGLSFAVWSSPPIEGAEPLVCVNGGMLFDHAVLWPALSPLAAGRQVILYDQRGRGASQAPPDPNAATVEDDAADLGALRRALGIRRWDVLGHSWGGGIAALGTALDPAGVRRLVLVDAVGPTGGWMAGLRANVLARLDGEPLAEYLAIAEDALTVPDPDVHAAHARASYPAWFADAELGRYFTPPAAGSQTGAAVLARLRADTYDWRPTLRALSPPTFVIHGELDALPVAVSDDWMAILPRARRLIIPHCGHMPFWEAPRRFFDAVQAYLAAPTPDAAPLPP